NAYLLRLSFGVSTTDRSSPLSGSNVGRSAIAFIVVSPPLPAGKNADSGPLFLGRRDAVHPDVAQPSSPPPSRIHALSVSAVTSTRLATLARPISGMPL